MSDQDRPFRFKDGRRYHGYEEEAYSLPNDEAEAQRLDFQHELWRISLNDKLYISPITPVPGFRVLDVGTGTGIWAIEFARANSSTQVIGTDLSAIQSQTSVPGNCQFQVANAEEDWAFSQPFDFIHSRLLYFGMHDWPNYFRRCYSNIKPEGWVEVQESGFPLLCDDGSVSPDSALMRWSNLSHEAMVKRGMDTALGERFKDDLSTQGFVNVQEKFIEWPSGPWPKDEVGKEMGRLQMQNVLMALESLSMMLLTKQLGWTMEEVEALLQEVRKDFDDLGQHTYFRA